MTVLLLDNRATEVKVTVRVRHDGQLLMGHEWREAAAGRRFEVTDPASGAVVGSTPDADESDGLRGG